jgi:RHS repeat-associated protein
VASIGLYFYNARWYDSALGRFVQADTIIPNPGDPPSYDRFAYVRNSPIKYIDPSGHNLNCGVPGSAASPEDCAEADPNSIGIIALPDEQTSVPEVVDQEQLSEWGKNMYWLYTRLFWARTGWWWTEYGADGYFSIIDFLHLILSLEFGPLEGVDDQFIDDLAEAGARGFWCSPNEETNRCAYPTSFSGGAILDWMGNGLGSAKMRFDAVAGGASVFAEFSTNQYNPGIATSVIDAISNPLMAWRSFDQNRPMKWGNYSMYKNEAMKSALEGYLTTNVVQNWGISSGDPFFILTFCQSAYFSGDNNYLNTFCN